MTKVKAKCSNCEDIIALNFDDGEWKYLQDSEQFEYKCLNCRKWAVFKLIDNPK